MALALFAASDVPRTLFGVEKQYAATHAANLHKIAPVLLAMQVARHAPALEDWPLTRDRLSTTVE